MKEVNEMTNYREILRLNSLGLNKTQIAEVLFPASAAKPEYKMPDY